MEGTFSNSSGTQIVNVLVQRLAGIDLVLDAVEAGHQHGGERQIRVAARIGRTELHALGLRVEAEYIGMRQAAERLRRE